MDIQYWNLKIKIRIVKKKNNGGLDQAGAAETQSRQFQDII